MTKEEFGEDVVAFQFKECLEDGVILHILQMTDNGPERYKIDMTFDAFKSLITRVYKFSIKHPELIQE